MGQWLASEWHKFVIGLLALDHLWDRVEPWFKRFQGIERRIEDRRKHMNVFELPQVLKDVVQMCNDVKAAESVLAPQFPQLVADAERIKTDVEKLLGINDIAAPMAPPPAA